jgi:hypothetical protein
MGAERALAGVAPADAPESVAPLVALRGVRKAFGSGTVFRCWGRRVVENPLYFG